MQIYFTGVQALPIAGLLSVLVGVGVGQFILMQPVLTGLIDLFVETLIVQQLAPLIAAIVVIARTSSAVSVELGNMRVAREVEMLEAFGISPWRHLALPRLLGIVIGTTALCYLSAAIAVFALFVVVGDDPTIGGVRFLVNIDPASGARVGALGFAYGIVIALVALNQGMNLQPRYTEVPKAASRAVVKSIVLCALVDAVLSVVLR
jgi:phospholipid/cholesterol/gamma-HCH transport system permease protein